MTVTLSTVQFTCLIGGILALILGGIITRTQNIKAGLFTVACILALTGLITGSVYKFENFEQRRIKYQQIKNSLIRPWTQLVDKLEEPEGLRHDLNTKRLLLHQFLQTQNIPQI